MINWLQEAQQRVRSESDNEATPSSSSKRRTSSKDVTAQLIEEEMRAALASLKTSESTKATFPIANAVGK